MHATQQHSPTLPCPSTDPTLCDRIARLAEQGPLAVNARLAELNAEWAIGRWVKVVCGLTLLVGLVLTFTLSPWWLVLIAVGGATLAQYLFFRRSWMGVVLAACGVRSGAVIEDERVALRVLRGDFKGLPTLSEIREEGAAVSRMVGEGGPALDDDDEKVPTREAAQLITAGSVTERNE